MYQACYGVCAACLQCFFTLKMFLLVFAALYLCGLYTLFVCSMYQACYFRSCPGMLWRSVPGMLWRNVPGMLWRNVPGMLWRNVPGMIWRNVPGMLWRNVPGMLWRMCCVSTMHFYAKNVSTSFCCTVPLWPVYFVRVLNAYYAHLALKIASVCLCVCVATGGCNHMKCQCGSAFCWLCGRQIDDQTFPAHFQWWNPTGCSNLQVDAISPIYTFGTCCCHNICWRYCWLR